ncbi:DUF4232 domain-containing protein [Streptomyces sp. VRA16 Mangrove soil]|uniref:DUF4232 domain-containing protein n=1 Tax=Streptomyces sp. VRA16 Mangrove soil TaxID=2817434 RepID=UPI001A9D1B32|nr:DUF4232 domain-containing protein [Streptomyces sp. VRA16 Mangrove soil]MBO1332910.1 DUF4232 domain-containing protein [Streptomyces sp. VRA16 Mangrove soil]
MRARHLSAVAAAALTLTALTAPAAVSAGRPAVCSENDLTVRAEPSDDTEGVVMLSVRNDSAKACAIAGAPTVTYGDLDGAAQPRPVPHGDHRLAAHATAYAAVRSLAATEDAENQGAVVTSIKVAASPDQGGRGFQAMTLGAPAGLRVWEPVTTPWLSSTAHAEQVVRDETEGWFAA